MGTRLARALESDGAAARLNPAGAPRSGRTRSRQHGRGYTLAIRQDRETATATAALVRKSPGESGVRCRVGMSLSRDAASRRKDAAGGGKRKALWALPFW